MTLKVRVKGRRCTLLWVRRLQGSLAAIDLISVPKMQLYVLEADLLFQLIFLQLSGHEGASSWKHEKHKQTQICMKQENMPQLYVSWQHIYCAFKHEIFWSILPFSTLAYQCHMVAGAQSAITPLFANPLQGEIPWYEKYKWSIKIVVGRFEG